MKKKIPFRGALLLFFLGVAFESALAGEIQVTSPRKGEVWQKDSAYTVRWKKDYEKASSGVQIHLFRGEESEKTISLGTTNDGSSRFRVPMIVNRVPTGREYRIRVRDQKEKTIVGFSDYFSIERSLRVMDPQAGLDLRAPGNLQQVRWNNDYLGAAPKVGVYLCDGERRVATISARASNAGERGMARLTPSVFNWRVPFNIPDGDRYRIQVVDDLDAKNNAYSDFFTIDNWTILGKWNIWFMWPSGGKAGYDWMIFEEDGTFRNSREKTGTFEGGLGRGNTIRLTYDRSGTRYDGGIGSDCMYGQMIGNIQSLTDQKLGRWFARRENGDYVSPLIGKWKVTYTWDNGAKRKVSHLEFRRNGTFQDEDAIGVYGDSSGMRWVAWWYVGTTRALYQGNFVNRNQLEGEMEGYGQDGEWIAERVPEN